MKNSLSFTLVNSLTMKNIVYLVILSPFFFSACKKNDSVSAPVACFSVDMTESTDSTHTFLFDQCPPAYDASYWDFGDGQYSSNPNPSHQFNHYGMYNVKLTVTNSAALTNSVTHTITIGHYSVDKVIVEKTSTYFSFPYTISLSLSSIPNAFAVPQMLYDTLFSAASLPLVYKASANSNYDYTNDPMYFYYAEFDSFAQLDSVFPISTSQIINKQKSVVIDFTPYDTAKFMIYFKIVPH